MILDIGHDDSSLLNEVLSLNAQESTQARASAPTSRAVLNEVLSLNAQESLLGESSGTV